MNIRYTMTYYSDRAVAYRSPGYPPGYLVTPALPGAPREGGAKISNSRYLAAKMYHTSFCGGEKILGGNKKLYGAPKSP